jgi:uroporphyrinogen-III synthase
MLARLAEAGALPLELPLIEVADPADGGTALARALSERDTYEWVVFTSANAVERCWRHLGDARAIGRARIAAVGSATAAALSDHGVRVDLLPEQFVAESLVEMFPAPAAAGRGAVLLPCAAGAREVLAGGLRAKGWRVEVVEAYRTVRATPGAEALETIGEADVITFTSSSAVAAFLDLAGLGRLPAVVACIGPVTARTAAQAGMRVDVVAAEHTGEGLVAALVEWVERRADPRERG